MRILAISGSLQAASSNTALVRAAQRLAPDGMHVDVFPSLADLPYFNPDLDRDPPAAVATFRGVCQTADAVLIASPEYAHEIPGVLKNALDWLVGSGELYVKPVGILSASPRPTGGQYMRAALEHTLTTQGAHVIVSATIQIPPHSLAADGSLDHEPALVQLTAALAALHTASAQAPAMPPTR